MRSAVSWFHCRARTSASRFHPILHTKASSKIGLKPPELLQIQVLRAPKRVQTPRKRPENHEINTKNLGAAPSCRTPWALSGSCPRWAPAAVREPRSSARSDTSAASRAATGPPPRPRASAPAFFGSRNGHFLIFMHLFAASSRPLGRRERRL